jgi:hypothetical protein
LSLSQPRYGHLPAQLAQLISLRLAIAPEVIQIHAPFREALVEPGNGWLVIAYLVIPPLVCHLVHDQVFQFLGVGDVILAADEVHAGKFHPVEGQWRLNDGHFPIRVGPELVAVDLECCDRVV